MKKTVLFLVLFCTTTLFSQTFAIDNIIYTVSGAEASVTGNTISISTPSNIIIPSTVSNAGTTFSVTSIGTTAFAECIRLTSISLPSSVTSIGNTAFFGCTSLTSISLPSSVTSIGIGAFYECYGLTSITLPDSLTSIVDFAFYHCNGLTSITLPDSLTSINRSAFSGCTGLTSITLPDSLTSIRSSAFRGCYGLTSFTINAVTPPTILSNVFTNVTLGSVNLYVPTASIATYKSESVWSGFNFSPIITGPGPSTASTSSLSMNENSVAVTTFTADETVTWSLGASNDETLFSIDSNSGVLVFNAAPDYESPFSNLQNNTYIVEVKATDTNSVTTSQQLTISITNLADSPAVLSNFDSFTVSSATSDFTIKPPTSNSSGAITYTSSNPAVATITGTTVHLVGPGTTTITATQAADGSYLGNTISATMNVSALCGNWGYPLTYPPTTITIIPN